MTIKNKIILLIIFCIGLSFRLYGLNWDQGQHLHPDERFLTMVTTDIKIPSTIFQYFNNKQSPLNPYNYPSYQFFVYGTFPIFLTKISAVTFNLDNYENIVLVGRVLSACFDSVNIFLLYFLSLKLFDKKSKLLFLPSLLYAFCVLPIQLSHFYAVDTFLNTFIFLTFVLLIYNRLLSASISFGLALACKISALYFLPIIFIFLVTDFIKNKRYLRDVMYYLILLFIAFVVFRTFQPYAFINFFTLNPLFINSLRQLQSMSSELSIHFPPSVQWMSKTKLIFPLQNIIVFGLGLPLSLSIIFIKQIKINYVNVLSIFWILIIILYQGTQSVYTMRYFLPIYPFFVLTISQIIPKRYYKLILIAHLLYCIMFLVIYSVPHSRVQASDWINQNISPNSIISAELWDDALPLGSNKYKIETLEITGPDTSDKWDKINYQLESIDYTVLSSNRSWASVSAVPNLLPKTYTYYRNIFLEKPLLEINSYPGFRLPIKNCYYFGPTNMPNNNSWFSVDSDCNYPGIYLRDDLAEEAFTVYDHPKVLIYKNK